MRVTSGSAGTGTRPRGRRWATVVATITIVAGCAPEDDSASTLLLTIPPTLAPDDTTSAPSEPAAAGSPQSAQAAGAVVALGTQHPPVRWQCPLPSAIDIARTLNGAAAIEGSADVRPELQTSVLSCVSDATTIGLTVGPTTLDEFLVAATPRGVDDAEYQRNSLDAGASDGAGDDEIFGYCVVSASLGTQRCGAAWSDGSLWVDVNQTTAAPDPSPDVQPLADALSTNARTLIEEAAAIDLVSLIQWYRITNAELGPDTSLDGTAGEPILAPTGAVAGQRWRFVNLGGGRYEVSNAASGETRLLSTDGTGSFFTDGPAQLPGQVWTVIAEPNDTHLVFSDIIETLVFLVPNGAGGTTVIPFGAAGATQWQLEPAGAIEP
ncbi:MAG: hypothetical protein AAGF73_04005 [Actinomycetota bacterium]